MQFGKLEKQIHKFMHLDHGLLFLFDCLRNFKRNELLIIQINVVGLDGIGVEGHGQVRFVYSYKVEAPITNH